MLFSNSFKNISQSVTVKFDDNNFPICENNNNEMPNETLKSDENLNKCDPKTITQMSGIETNLVTHAITNLTVSLTHIRVLHTTHDSRILTFQGCFFVCVCVFVCVRSCAQSKNQNANNQKTNLDLSQLSKLNVFCFVSV